MSMQRIALVCVSLACAGHARRVSVPLAEEQNALDSLAMLLQASDPAASFIPAGPAAHLTRPVHARMAPAIVRRGGFDVLMEEDTPSSNAVTVGAAALGGILGVQFTGEVLPSILAALFFAYLSTLSNGLGSAVKSGGKVAAKVYKIGVDINEEYDVLPKVKGAVDSTINVADNINKNYGITDRIDKQLLLSETVQGLTDKFDEATGALNSKVDDLKSKASSS